MGRDKALIECGGKALWQRQVELLDEFGCSPCFLSVRDDQAWVPPTHPRVQDARGGVGPLAGIIAALRATSAPHLVVLAVDLPRMERSWFEELRAGCVPGQGAVGRREGFFEPLAAIYPRELLPLAEDALQRGKFSLQALLELAAARRLVKEVAILPECRAWFENWNEPRDVTSA